MALLANALTVLSPPSEASTSAPSAGIAAARAQVFESWNATMVGEPTDRLIPFVSSGLMGGPAWPVREAYALMRDGENTIVATDGLSDPIDADWPHGFQLEVWAETDQQLADPARSWLTALVAAVGYQIAAGVFEPWHLEPLGVLSLEIPLVQLQFEGSWPASIVTPNGTIAVLIGSANKQRPDWLPAPFDDVRYCNIRILTPGELQELLRGDAETVKRLAGKGTVSRLPAD